MLIGHSAGAHLVMQLLADPQYLRAVGMETDVSAFVKGAVGISGVYNIVRIANTAFYGSFVVRYVDMLFYSTACWHQTHELVYVCYR